MSEVAQVADVSEADAKADRIATAKEQRDALESTVATVTAAVSTKLADLQTRLDAGEEVAIPSAAELLADEARALPTGQLNALEQWLELFRTTVLNEVIHPLRAQAQAGKAVTVPSAADVFAKYGGA